GGAAHPSVERAAGGSRPAAGEFTVVLGRGRASGPRVRAGGAGGWRLRGVAGTGVARRPAPGPARRRLREAWGGRVGGSARRARSGRYACAVAGAVGRGRATRDVARVATGFPGRGGVPVAAEASLAALTCDGCGFFPARPAPTEG